MAKVRVMAKVITKAMIRVRVKVKSDLLTSIVGMVRFIWCPRKCRGLILIFTKLRP